MSQVVGGTLKCECGRLYHVSLFHDVLTLIAQRAYARGRATPSDVVEESIQEGYQYGREMEKEYAIRTAESPQKSPTLAES